MIVIQEKRGVLGKKKPVLVSLCPLQIENGLSRALTQVSWVSQIHLISRHHTTSYATANTVGIHSKYQPVNRLRLLWKIIVIDYEFHSGTLRKHNVVFFTLSKNCERQLLASSCLSVRPSTWNSLVPTEWIFTKFDI
jgi:hypothetical protein